MLKIYRRQLKNDEIDLLVTQMKKSPHVGLLSKKLWQKLDCVYAARMNNYLVGACVLYKLKNWIKIGPIVVLDKFQGKGYGKKLITKIVDDYPNINLFISSSNPIVVHIVQDLGFKKLKNFFALPREIKIYFAKYFLERLSVEFLIDDFRKKIPFRLGKYSFFCKM